jgi:serine/threonine protein kinase
MEDPQWNEHSAEVKDIVSKLLIRDPAKRLTAQQALGHPWFKG